MADLTLTVRNRTLSLPQSVPPQITNTEYIDKVAFDCDSEYSGYTLVAVFKNGERGKPYPVEVPADRSAVAIDPRALRRKGFLYIGMFGVRGLNVLPTLWSPAIEIKEGTSTDEGEPDTEAPRWVVLATRVAALETAVGELEEDVGELEEDVGELEEDVGELEEDVGELEGSVEALAEDVAAVEDEVEELQSGKQDVITDLDTIRSGAAAGATALQSVPIATPDTVGGGKFSNGLGLYVMTSGAYNGQVRTYPANDSDITGRSNNYRPITPANMDTAFRTCITDPAQELTDNQKEEACATIGAVSHFDGFRKIIDYTTTDSETGVIMFTHDDEGEPISLQYEDIIIKTYFPHGTVNTDVRVFTRETDTSWHPKNMLLYYSSGYMVNGLDSRYTMAYIKNVWRGAWTTLKQTYSSSETQYSANACNPSNAFCEVDGEKIVRFRFGLAGTAGAFPAGGKIEIYVK